MCATEDSQERLRKQRRLDLEGPETGGTAHPLVGDHLGGHEAKAGGGESPSQSLYWGFHGKGRAGQGEQLKTGYFK